MTLAETVAKAVYVLTDAEGGGLPTPASATFYPFSPGRVYLLLDEVDDLGRWADWLGAEEVTTAPRKGAVHHRATATCHGLELDLYAISESKETVS